MAPSCKLELARFSALWKIQDGAECGNNHEISAKKKFGILLKLMKNNKFSAIAPLYENPEIINDSVEKDRIFNSHFASNSNLIGKNDDPPILQKKRLS